MASQPSPTLEQDPEKPVSAFSQPLMWMVVGIPAATVVAGLTTLWIAINGADTPVATDFVKQGMAVSPDMRREARAVELGVAGVMDMRMGREDTLDITVSMLPGRTGGDGGDDSEGDGAKAGGGGGGDAGIRAGGDGGAAFGMAGAPGSGTGAAAQTATADLTPRRLRLLHPSDPTNDVTLHLLPAGKHRWQAHQPVTWTAGTRWHIALEGGDWRMAIPGLQTVESMQDFHFDARKAAAQAHEPRPGEQSASDPARRKGTAPASR